MNYVKIIIDFEAIRSNITPNGKTYDHCDNYITYNNIGYTGTSGSGLTIFLQKKISCTFAAFTKNQAESGVQDFNIHDTGIVIDSSPSNNAVKILPNNTATSSGTPATMSAQIQYIHNGIKTSCLVNWDPIIIIEEEPDLPPSK